MCSPGPVVSKERVRLLTQGIAIRETAPRKWATPGPSHRESAMRIGIIGAGNVGGTLGKAWAARGHDVRFGVRDADDPKVKELLAAAGTKATAASVAEAAAFAEAIVLCVPYGAIA